MPTTTNYGWTTPADTDLVKNGASAIRTLGTAADTTVKNLNPGTTAGDIDYYTSSTAKSRLAIGSAGQVLTVASGVPSWAAAPASVPANNNATVATSQTTTSATYTDLATAGPAVTVTTGTRALVIVSALIEEDIDGRKGYMDFAVSGATSRSASDTTALILTSPFGTNTFRASAATIVTLTAGSNTFTAKYHRSPSGTATFTDREIIVINMA